MVERAGRIRCSGEQLGEPELDVRKRLGAYAARGDPVVDGVAIAGALPVDLDGTPDHVDDSSARKHRVSKPAAVGTHVARGRVVTGTKGDRLARRRGRSPAQP